MKTSRGWGTIGTVQIEAQKIDRSEYEPQDGMDRARVSALGRDLAAVGLHMQSTFWQLKGSRKVITASQNNSCSGLQFILFITLSDSMTKLISLQLKIPMPFQWLRSASLRALPP